MKTRQVLDAIRFSGGVPAYTGVAQNPRDIEAKKPLTGKGEINTWLPYGRTISKRGEVDPHWHSRQVHTLKG